MSLKCIPEAQVSEKCPAQHGSGRRRILRCLQVPDFSPIERVGGYLPIADHGVIGDGATAALVGRDGAIDWMCVPRFDSPPLFAAILDKARGGAFTIAPRGLRESRQHYEPQTGVLVTEMRSDTGVIRLTDALTLHAGADLGEDASAARHELLRSVQVLAGEVELDVTIAPRGGAEVLRRSGGGAICCAGHPGLDLQLRATVDFQPPSGVVKLRAGERADFFLWWAGRHRVETTPGAGEILAGTVRAWRRWVADLRYQGPQAELVERSAITLKLISHFENGAFVAAATSSLPELPGGERNWDYRFSWVRDAAFSAYAFYRVGLVREAGAFLGWVMDAVESGERPMVLYDLDGREAPPEREDLELEGYRGSRPVRWGNAAATQEQHDAYGEIVDSAYQWARHNGRVAREVWVRLRELVETARGKWRTPDRGIWEVRGPARRFTYSAALCQVALDRGARMAESLGAGNDARAWHAESGEIRRTILEEAWHPEERALAAYVGGRALDASLLALPLRRVVPADHPKMIATTDAICRRLGAGGGLLYRYLPDEMPDGLRGHEGAFLLCSFWLVDNLALQGRLQEAYSLFDSLCARANSVGLLAEQIDPSDGAFLGNFPQAFSHVGLISSAMNLERTAARLAARKSGRALTR